MSHPRAIVTGSGGWIGPRSVRHFVARFRGPGIGNDMRARFFGSSASTARTTAPLQGDYGSSFVCNSLDIRHNEGIGRVFASVKPRLKLVIQTAAQPSHDSARSEPCSDLTINAGRKLNLLKATRTYAPEATFIYCFTEKVYGDTPNRLLLQVSAERPALLTGRRYRPAIDTTTSIDGSTHSPFGVSTTLGGLLVQEYVNSVHAAPRCGAVYNVGGGRQINCSVREADAACERIAGKALRRKLDSTLAQIHNQDRHL